jgi:hypothetical protein
MEKKKNSRQWMSDDLISKRISFTGSSRKNQKKKNLKNASGNSNLSVFDFQGAAAGINVSSI